jgi:trimeric autotransporter adhesin
VKRSSIILWHWLLRSAVQAKAVAKQTLWLATAAGSLAVTGELVTRYQEPAAAPAEEPIALESFASQRGPASLSTPARRLPFPAKASQPGSYFADPSPRDSENQAGNASGLTDVELPTTEALGDSAQIALSGLAMSQAEAEAEQKKPSAEETTASSGNGGSQKKTDTTSNTSTSTATSTASVATWELASAGDYTFDSTYISVSGGVASLKTVDSSHDSESELSAGTHLGTTYASGALKLGTSLSGNSELSSYWAPQYSSLVYHAKMNNDWADATGLNSAGVAAGNAGFVASPKQGSHAGSFDGVGADAVIVADNDALDNTNRLTISAWVKPAVCDAGNFRPILGKRSGFNANHSYVIFSNGCRLEIDIDDSGNRFQSASSLTLNQWNHVVLVYDGTLAAANRVKLYLNSSLDTTATETSATLPNYASSLGIGALPDGGGLDPFSGHIDELAIWSTALTAAEVRTLYDRQRTPYSGTFLSPVIDMGASLGWTSLASVSPLPFFKELAGSAESSSAYASINAGGANLFSQLTGLWHLNETAWTGAASEVADSSGAATPHHGQSQGNAATEEGGRFSRAGAFDGAGDYVNLGAFAKTASFTISAWVDFDGNFTQQNIGGIVFGGSDNTGWGLSSNFFNGKLFMRISTGAASQNYPLDDLNSTNYPPGWHHLVVMADTTNISFYKNGKFVMSTAQTLQNGGGSPDLSIGRWGDWAGADSYFAGRVDEVAIWSRALSADEVLQLYRRGGNRAKFLVRTCDDSACSGESWSGPTGSSGASYFSELHNNTAINASGEGSGTVQANGLSVAFADFSAAGLSLPANRYFQYQVVLESDDENSLCSGSACVPELSSVTVGPTGRYYAGSPSITNVSGVSYSSLSSLLITTSGSCSPTHQLSSDGSQFYYWNGSAWAAASAGVTHSASAASTMSNISSFTATAGSGRFFFRSYLTSTTTESCSLESVRLDYYP